MGQAPSPPGRPRVVDARFGPSGRRALRLRWLGRSRGAVHLGDPGARQVRPDHHALDRDLDVDAPVIRAQPPLPEAADASRLAAETLPVVAHRREPAVPVLEWGKRCTALHEHVFRAVGGRVLACVERDRDMGVLPDALELPPHSDRAVHRHGAGRTVTEREVRHRSEHDPARGRHMREGNGLVARRGSRPPPGATCHRSPSTRVTPASRQPASISSMPNASIGPSAPVPSRPPVATRSPPHARIRAVNS